MTEDKNYAVYELKFGQPCHFYNEEQNKIVNDAEPSVAALYTKEEAEAVRRKLLQPRVDYYQKTGQHYTEIHIGDLYAKGLLLTNKELKEKLKGKSLEEIKAYLEARGFTTNDFSWKIERIGKLVMYTLNFINYDNKRFIQVRKDSEYGLQITDL